jgi:predicted nucleic acid-binding protein
MEVHSAERRRAIDANVILRYVLHDIPEQAARARRLIESTEPLGVTAIALAEAGWTLTGPSYRRSRAAAASALADLLARGNVIALGFDKALAGAALLTCIPEIGGANIGDALLAACSQSEGVNEIYSFDETFKRTGMTVIAP